MKIADDLNLGNWQAKPAVPDDVGERPPLDSLGPVGPRRSSLVHPSWRQAKRSRGRTTKEAPILVFYPLWLPALRRTAGEICPECRTLRKIRL